MHALRVIRMTLSLLTCFRAKSLQLGQMTNWVGEGPWWVLIWWISRLMGLGGCDLTFKKCGFELVSL